MIDRMHICEEFKAYTDAYDSSDIKIKLKIDHTYRVAQLSEEIAKSILLSDEDVDIAWCIGMLHDIGRFEQVKRYGTFIDSQSIDHAQFGADLLFEDGLAARFLGDTVDVYGEVIEKAIRNHSAYRIEEGLSNRYAMFCNILRDADKIDILKVNTEIPQKDIINVPEEELNASLISEQVLNAFYEEHAILRAYRKTPADFLVGIISLTYELVYPKSYQLLDEQGYIYTFMDFHSDNPETEKKFTGIREHMRKFISDKIRCL